MFTGDLQVTVYITPAVPVRSREAAREPCAPVAVLHLLNAAPLDVNERGAPALICEYSHTPLDAFHLGS